MTDDSPKSSTKIHILLLASVVFSSQFFITPVECNHDEDDSNALAAMLAAGLVAKILHSHHEVHHVHIPVPVHHHEEEHHGRHQPEPNSPRMDVHPHNAGTQRIVVHHPPPPNMHYPAQSAPPHMHHHPPPYMHHPAQSYMHHAGPPPMYHSGPPAIHHHPPLPNFHHLYGGPNNHPSASHPVYHRIIYHPPVPAMPHYHGNRR